MRLNDAAKVGLAALVAAGLLVWVTFAIRGPLGRGSSYLQKVAFTDARGIQEGAPVRVRGVDVGQVHDVGLGSRGNAEVTLRVTKEYVIRPDDLIQIVGGTLGFGQPHVEILPGGRKQAATPGPDNILPGEAGTGTETILTRSEELLTNLNGLVTRLNRLTEGFAQTAQDPKIRTALARTLDNFEQISKSGVTIAKNMEGATANADRLITGFERTTSRLDRTLREAESVMGGFRGTATEAQALMRDTRQVVRQTEGVIQSAGTLVQNTNAVVQDTGAVVKRSGELVGDLQGAVGENRERLKAVFENLDGSLKQLSATLEETRSFIGDPELRGDLKTTASNVRTATENLKQITQDFRGVTGDPKVQEDLKATLTNLRDASAEAAETFRRVRGVLGGGASRTLKGVGRALGGTEFRVDSTYGVESSRARFDLDATVPWANNTFYRLGLYDFGETTRFNAQAGQRLSRNVWGRFGIHGSKLGVGLDVGNPARPPLALDLYSVNDPRLDARGYVPIGRSLDITLGVDNIFRRPDPVFGLRYRR